MLVLDQLVEGQALETLTNEPITVEQLKQYAQASGDLNPIHTDENVAKSVGLPSTIAHGMLIMGQLGRYVNQIAGENATVKNFSMRFGAMTFPNEQITCSAVVESVIGSEATINVYASKGENQIVGNGQAVLVFEGEEA
ncbi:MAG TPA: MaoC/PaaZ C-terminal domain-containing protein [Kurthia sp.]